MIDDEQEGVLRTRASDDLDVSTRSQGGWPDISFGENHIYQRCMSKRVEPGSCVPSNSFAVGVSRHCWYTCQSAINVGSDCFGSPHVNVLAPHLSSGAIVQLSLICSAPSEMRQYDRRRDRRAFGDSETKTQLAKAHTAAHLSARVSVPDRDDVATAALVGDLYELAPLFGHCRTGVRLAARYDETSTTV